MDFSPYNDFGDPMFDLFNVLFVIVFLIILSVFVVGIVQNFKQRNRDDASPVLDVEAKLVTKRTDVGRHHTGENHVHSPSHTTYYATFEVQSKDRLEFVVTGTEYGQLVENDTGKLTFQGSRYLSFDRNT
ncbi:DUF2500 domain-containing protein [Amphibacillus indicireducens]|uniref:DUF2500 domain-containing protein n=1 Tax=Amphibacillus indicireducens TaxID=1076330 RepID=A0ABP7VS50_9BACI